LGGGFCFEESSSFSSSVVSGSEVSCSGVVGLDLDSGSGSGSGVLGDSSERERIWKERRVDGSISRFVSVSFDGGEVWVSVESELVVVVVVVVVVESDMELWNWVCE
jgi:hypothetical protein